MWRIGRLPSFRSVLIFGGLYLLGQVTSDLYRSTPAEDLLRGWAKIGVTLVCVVFFAALMEWRRNVCLAFVLGSLASPLLSLMMYGQTMELYKFYIGLPISGLCFLLVDRVRGALRPAIVLLPLVAAAVAFLQNCRALAAVTLLSFSVVQFRWIVPKAAQLSRWKLAGGAILAGILAYGILEFYTFAAPRGYLGVAALEKFESQTVRTGTFTLFSGRSEIHYVAPKILESPVIGHGSWAKDFDYVAERASALGENAAFYLSGDTGSHGLIPSHSHIFGAWLEAGILGAVFWCLIAWRAGRVVVASMTTNYEVSPLFVFCIVGFLWDIFFSPYGGERRTWNGFLIAWFVWTEIDQGRVMRGRLIAQLPRRLTINQRALQRSLTTRRDAGND
jgi:hypothetical protein